MEEYSPDVLVQAHALAAQIATLPLAGRIAALNAVRATLTTVSPFRTEPIDHVQWYPADHVCVNDYNPNHVAPPALRWLERSVITYGFALPVIGTPEDHGTITVVDGAHRANVGRAVRAVRERMHNYLPVVVLRTRPDLLARYGATQAFNRARGEHAVPDERAMVLALVREGYDLGDIGVALGKTPDEILRFMQTSGLTDLFRDRAYNRARE